MSFKQSSDSGQSQGVTTEFLKATVISYPKTMTQRDAFWSALEGAGAAFRRKQLMFHVPESS